MKQNNIIILNGETIEQRKKEIEKIFNSGNGISALIKVFDENNDNKKKIKRNRIEALNAFFGKNSIIKE